MVTEINGCGTREDQTLVRQGTPSASIAQEENNDNITELEEIEEPIAKAYKVYPNPTKGKFYMAVSNPEKVEQVLVIDIRGNIIKTFKNKFSFLMEIDLTGKAKGVYVVKVIEKNTSKELKVFVK